MISCKVACTQTGQMMAASILATGVTDTEHTCGMICFGMTDMEHTCGMLDFAQ